MCVYIYIPWRFDLKSLNYHFAELGRFDVIIQHVRRLVEFVELVAVVSALGEQEVLLAARRPEQVGHHAVSEAVNRVRDTCENLKN